MNFGGAGATLYGAYCVVLSGEPFQTASEPVAYLRGDSLKTYVQTIMSFNVDALQRDVAPHSHRHAVAVIKHKDQIPVTREPEWPKLLCSDIEYIEAVFTRRVEGGDIESVRIRSAEYQELFKHGFVSFCDKLNDERRFLVDAFVVIKRALRARNIALEAVPDA